MKAVFFDVEAIVLQSSPSGPSFLNNEVRPELERLILDDIPLFAVTEVTTDCWNARVDKIPQFSVFFKAVLALGQPKGADQIQEAFRTFLDINGLRASDCLYFYDEDSQLDKRNITAALGMESEILTKWLYVRLVSHGVYWPDARSAAHEMTREEIILAGTLAKHIAVKMCSLYDHMSGNAEPFPVRDQISTAREWEQRFDKGDPFSHAHMSAFESAAYCLQETGLAQMVKNDEFKLLVNPTDIPAFIANQCDRTKEKYALVVEAFFDIEGQCGWEENYFDADLANKFIAAGLVCDDNGHLIFRPSMDPYFAMCGVVSSSMDADAFFRKICAR